MQQLTDRINVNYATRIFKIPFAVAILKLKEKICGFPARTNILLLLQAKHGLQNLANRIYASPQIYSGFVNV
jgi:hypothetical protein